MDSLREHRSDARPLCGVALVTLGVWLWAAGGLAAAQSAVPERGGASEEPSVHHVPKDMVVLDSEAGRALLPVEPGADFRVIMDNHVAQQKSHCGAASAVVVLNALQPDRHLTQDSLFTEETAHIITQDVVYRIGFTLEELTEMIRVRSGLRAEGFHAGSGAGHHSHEEFLAALRENRTNSDDQILVNYSTESVRGRGTGAGHWSPVAEYNEAEDMVLILEVYSEWETFWIPSRDLHDAMNTVDSVCDRHRGWIVVSR